MLRGKEIMQKLAIAGGTPAIGHGFKNYNSIGKEELAAASRVIKSGVLSKFLGCWNEDFYGGEKVREFEKRFAGYFGTRYAVSINSATSGLIAAVGACSLGPGDEVIVSPYTMTATAAAILVFNAIPVFADIDEKTFNLSPEAINRCITGRTRAIVVPNIFGYPADYKKILKIARKNDLKIIEDNAQAPSAVYHGRYSGTIGDVGVFSLNYHKHIHTGEGGVCLTDSRVLAERMQLIRNHAEAVVEKKGVRNLINMIGFNFRMGEIEAAMGIEQLKKLKKLVGSRIEIARILTAALTDIDLLIKPYAEKGSTHVYYTYPLRYVGKKIGRDMIVEALRAEGVPISAGYVKPLYLQPLYRQHIVYGNKGCPFTCSFYRGKIKYEKGICPVAERVNDKELLLIDICKHDLNRPDISAIGGAFHKVFDNLEQLKNV